MNNFGSFLQIYSLMGNKAFVSLDRRRETDELKLGTV